jgi:hypothetical protein
MSSARGQEQSMKSKVLKGGLLIITIMVVVSFVQNVRSLQRGRLELAKIQEKIRIEEEKNQKAKKDLEIAQSNTYKEQQIREKLGLVKEGETLVVLPDKNEVRRLGEVQVTEKKTQEDPNWLQWVKLFL